ncbi:MAG: metallophosphoesterase [Bacteroidota bacterium]
MPRHYLLYFLLFLSSCASQKPFYNTEKNWKETTPAESDEVVYTTFFIGDAGEPSLEVQEPVLKFLDTQLKATSGESTVVFLGDNIYQIGLPDSNQVEKRQLAESKLVEQLKFLKTYEGRVFFIPGNHDWAKSKAEGWQFLKNQEEFIENYLNRDENVFLPDNGCPTPIEVPLTDDIVLICIDTQWWLHPHDKPGEESDCEAKNEAEFILQLNDIVAKNEGKKILVAAHHPMISNGVHGGYFPLIEHLFPLQRRKIYIPTPVLGSVYVAYRKFIGSRQDIPNEDYQRLKDALFTIFEKHPDLMYFAGHDHSLQYHQKHNFHHIISGAGSKESYVARKKKATFAYSKKGFVKISFYESGQVWAEFMTPEGDGETGKVAFRQLLFTQKNREASPDIPSTPDYTDSTVVTALGDYEAGRTKKLLWGKNYRNEWQAEVAFPVFDITKVHGGLEIVKRGGGMATNSLRLEAKDGKQYVLRSVDKEGDKALTEEFRGTFVGDIVQDQTSSAYPYGALTVPKMAEAIGIYHANPVYVYLPKDDNLGKYKSLGGAVYLFEERPDDEFWEESDNFGNPKEIRSTGKVIEKLQEDNDNQVDELFVLKNRLFDILIGDWDRHDDQWRWAEFKDKKAGTRTYQPIPRDRDQVFFSSDGLILNVGTHDWGVPKFQGFKSEIRGLEGFNFNGRYFDRYFLTEPTLEDWLAVADTLQRRLTEEVIDEALSAVPDEAAQYSLAGIRAKLLQRKQDLKTYARDYYLFLSRHVNVLGSDKHERFEVERLNDEETRVTVFKIKKESREIKRKIYERVFKRSETKEICLYGFGGDDEFILTGEVRKGIKVRIIGGDDKDIIADSSQVQGLGKKTIVYDKIENTEIQEKGEVKDRLSSKESVNAYDRRAFKYDYLGPAFFVGYNPDDGIFLGGGVTIKKHGFRKAPFASRHEIKANYAVATNSFNFVYKGEFVDVIGKADLVLDAEIRSPNYVQNFFGLGNETENQSDELGINYYRVRYTQQYIEPSLRFNSQNQKHQLSFGPYFQSVEVEQTEGRFIDDFAENGLDPNDDIQANRYFFGVQTNYEYNSKDHPINPQRGVHFTFGAARITGLDDASFADINYTHLSSNFAFYKKLFPGLVLANRVGGAINSGQYQFYQANTLGGRNNLRGYRNYRFAGDIAFYNNTDLRLRLFKINTYFFKSSLGLLAIHDIGRVWLEDENSDKWHQGFGGGIWVNPANAFLLSTTLTHSEEGNVFFIRFGFLF